MSKNTYKSLQIAGVVILYDPPDTIVANIRSFIDSIELLIIINNGISDNSTIALSFPDTRIHTLHFPANIGVAAALNKAAEIAIKDQMDYLFLMDQDSSARVDLIGKYIQYIENNREQDLGLLSPNYIYKNFRTKNSLYFNQEVNFALTSGSFLSIKVYQKVGPFLEKLFIDYVDFEYCLRIKKNGYKIVQLTDVFIEHNLGNIVGRKFIFKEISVTHHSPERYYYRTRNRFYLYRTYFRLFPSVIIKDLIVFFNEIIKILLYEKNKIKKMKMIVKGLSHFVKNRYGKLPSSFNNL